MAKYYPPYAGGIETHVQTLARAQAVLGAQVTVLCINHRGHPDQPLGPTPTQVEWDGPVEVIRLGCWLSVARFDVCPGILGRMGHLQRLNYDVVHLHTPNPTMLLAWAIALIWLGLQQRRLPPLVVTHHSDIIRQQFLKYLVRPFEYGVYQRAAKILTDSPDYYQGSRFLQTLGKKVATLPLGLDTSIYQNPPPSALARAQQWRELSEGKPLWVFVGRLVYYKALEIAIQALPQVPGRLVVIGVGPMESLWRTLAHQLGVGDRIHWHGWGSQDDVVGAYHAATAFWFPSNQRSEGFGLVQLEAMASGCPVINAQIPCSGVPWVCRHEQEGLTVPLNNPRAFAQAAHRLLQEPGLRERLGRAARQRALEFDHHRMAHQSLSLYQQSLPRWAP